MFTIISLLALSCILVGCSDSDGTPAGTERGSCYPNGTCNAGLTCASGLCVRLEVGTDLPTRDDTTRDMVNPDVGSDSSVDTAPDAPSDATSDTPADASADSTVPDTTADSPVPDTTTDLPDSTVDGPPPDTTNDTSVDTAASSQCLFPAGSQGAIFHVEPKAGLDSLTPPLTVEAWVMHLPTGLFAGMIATRLQGTGQLLELRLEDPGGFYFSYYAPGLVGSVWSGSATSADGWHHAALACSPTQCQLFFDGSSVATSSQAGTWAAFTWRWIFGARATGTAGNWGQVLRAGLSEVRVSNTVRYSANFTPQRRFAPDSNTVGLWHLNEGSGTTATDSSQTASHGVIAAGTWQQCGQ